MKTLALVAALLSVASLPALAQNKFIKEANRVLPATETPATETDEKGKPVDEETRTVELADPVNATGKGTTEAPVADTATVQKESAVKP